MTAEEIIPWRPGVQLKPKQYTSCNGEVFEVMLAIQAAVNPPRIARKEYFKYIGLLMELVPKVTTTTPPVATSPVVAPPLPTPVVTAPIVVTPTPVIAPGTAEIVQLQQALAAAREQLAALTQQNSSLQHTNELLQSEKEQLQLEITGLKSKAATVVIQQIKAR